MAVTLRGTTVRNETAIEAWNPIVLFANNEPGAWYDPSDLGTLFQNSAGTTPVTAVEQAVGLTLDKSRGLALGPELVTNGDFSGGTTGWTASNSALTIDSGALRVTNNTGGSASPRAYQAIAFTLGRTYQITGTIPTQVGGGVGFGLNNAGDATVTQVIGTVTATGAFSFLHTVTAAANSFVVRTPGNVGASGFFDIDNISVRELSGTHLIQPSAPSRPILRARYNLLRYSEDFTNAVWPGFSGWSASDATTITATSSASNTRQGSLIQIVSGETYTLSVDLQKLSGAITSIAVDIGDGTPVTITLPTAGIERRTVTVTAGAAGAFLDVVAGAAGSFYISKIDLRRSCDTYLPYQRIAAATDYDTVGFPVYLAFDGSDDSMYTGGNLDLSATDRVTVWAGVTKLSDAARGVLLELSPSSANPGTFSIEAPSVAGDPRLTFFTTGSATSFAGVNNAIYAAPLTRVLTAAAVIADDVAILRSDGAQIASNTADQGTGNYSSAVLNVGRRNNASLPFNGRLYQLIVRGAATSDALIVQAERWNAQKQGRTL